MYANYIQERFERCLDMYLCPRTRKKRIHIDPESLVPKLPKPTDLQPFPVALCLEFLGHSAKVNSPTRTALGIGINSSIFPVMPTFALFLTPSLPLIVTPTGEQSERRSHRAVAPVGLQ
jgi:hypothetical protein